MLANEERKAICLLWNATFGDLFILGVLRNDTF